MAEAKLPRVLLLIDAYAGYARMAAEGVIRYARHHGPWEFVYPHVPTVDTGTVVTYGDAVDGVIATSGVLRRIATDALPEGKPMVGIISPDMAGPMPAVMPNNAAIGRMAYDFFQSRGYQHFAFVGYERIAFSEQRRQAFREAVQADEFSYHEHLGGGAEDLDDWIRSVPQPTALFAANVTAARRATDAARHARFLVPEEVAILAVDNDEMLCNLSFPPLSTIDHGAEEMGYRAAELLADLLDGKPAPDEPIVVDPIQIVENQSTDALAIDDPHLRQAIRYIRAHACDGIDVRDVMVAVPTSRRSLEMAFRRVLDRTIYQEITRVRLQRARELLIETDFAMPEVSVRCGYNYASQLRSAFQKVYNKSPSEFRREHRMT